MALGGLVLSSRPQRTCTGCRVVTDQGQLVRVGIEGSRLAIDAKRRLPGRGAYVHPRPSCITVPGLAKSLRRSVTPSDVQRLVSQMSPTDDNSSTSGNQPDKTALALGTGTM